MEIEEIKRFIKSHYPNLDEILFFEMHQTEILLFEMAKLKQKENEQLREELQDLETEGCKYDDIIKENTKLKERVKELEERNEDLQNNLDIKNLGNY